MADDLAKYLAEVEQLRQAAEAQARVESGGSAPPPAGNNSTLLQTADDVIRRAANSLTFGYADKWAAGLDEATGREGPAAGNLARQRQLTEDAAARLGRGGTLAADLAGGVLGAAATAPIAPTTLLARAPLAARVGAGAAEGAGMAALDAAGNDRPLTAANLATGAGIGAAIPFALRAIGGPGLSATERRAVDGLTAEGIPLTPGQATGSRPLKWAESVMADLPFASGAAKALNDRQGEAFNRAIGRRMGEADARLLDPDQMSATARRLSGEFQRLSDATTVRFDRQFGDELLNVLRGYGRKLPQQQRPILTSYVDDLAGLGGQMPGGVYQTTRSDLSRHAKSVANTDPVLADALRGLRDALDGAARRSMPEDIGRAWDATRRQYAAMKAVEKAATGAGERAAQGYVSPSALRNVVAAQDRAAYARGRGDLAGIARAGEAVLKPLPNSGTASRSMYGGMLAGGGAALAGDISTAATLAGLPLAAGLAGRAYLSPTVQRLLAQGRGNLAHQLMTAGYASGAMGATGGLLDARAAEAPASGAQGLLDDPGPLEITVRPRRRQGAMEASP